MLGIHQHGALLGGSAHERALKRAATARHGAALEAADCPGPAIYEDPYDAQHAAVSARARASIDARYKVERAARISTLGLPPAVSGGSIQPCCCMYKYSRIDLLW